MVSHIGPGVWSPSEVGSGLGWIKTFVTSSSGYILWFITVTSKWARRRPKSPASPLFTQPFIQVQIKENIKAPRHWPLCGEFTDDRWIPRTNGQYRGKCFHLMASSCIITIGSVSTCLFSSTPWPRIPTSHERHGISDQTHSYPRCNGGWIVECRAWLSNCIPHETSDVITHPSHNLTRSVFVKGVSSRRYLLR